MELVYLLLALIGLSWLTTAEEVFNTSSGESSSRDKLTIDVSKEELTTTQLGLHSSFNNTSNQEANLQPGSNSFDVGSNRFNVESNPPQGSNFQPPQWAPPSSGEDIEHQIANLTSQEQEKHRYEYITDKPNNTSNMFDLMQGDGVSQGGSNDFNHPMMSDEQMDKNKKSVGSWKELDMADHGQHSQNNTATVITCESSLLVLSSVLYATVYRLNTL